MATSPSTKKTTALVSAGSAVNATVSISVTCEKQTSAMSCASPGGPGCRTVLEAISVVPSPSQSGEHDSEPGMHRNKLGPVLPREVCPAGSQDGVGDQHHRIEGKLLVVLAREPSVRVERCHVAGEPDGIMVAGRNEQVVCGSDIAVELEVHSFVGLVGAHRK